MLKLVTTCPETVFYNVTEIWYDRFLDGSEAVSFILTKKRRVPFLPEKHEVTVFDGKTVKTGFHFKPLIREFTEKGYKVDERFHNMKMEDAGKNITVKA